MKRSILAGILMLAILAAISLTSQAFACSSYHKAYYKGHHSHSKYTKGEGKIRGTESVTRIPTALAAHSPAYLYGFGLGKNAGLRGYYDVMNDCSNRPYLSANVTGAIKNFTSLQQVNDCDSGYDHGWNQYYHIGLAKHSSPKTEMVSPNTSSTLL